jgi:FRG domain
MLLASAFLPVQGKARRILTALVRIGWSNPLVMPYSARVALASPTNVLPSSLVVQLQIMKLMNTQISSVRVRQPAQDKLIPDPVTDRSAWNQFLDEIQQARVDLGNPEVVWYRGQSIASWSLITSLQRATTGLTDSEALRREQLLFREYSRSAHRFHEQRDFDWGLLADMQHYGIPTRLLDWTEILGVAVAFATLRQYEQPADAAIFILDPAKLNEGIRSREVVHIPDPDFRYQSVYWEGKPIKATRPVAIDIPFQNPRILAQRGAFTVQGSERKALDEQCPDVVRKVVLPVDALNGAREFLDHANLNEYSIYPDIFGMAQHIVKQVFGTGRLR